MVIHRRERSRLHAPPARQAPGHRSAHKGAMRSAHKSWLSCTRVRPPLTGLSWRAGRARTSSTRRRPRCTPRGASPSPAYPGAGPNPIPASPVLTLRVPSCGSMPSCLPFCFDRGAMEAVGRLFGRVRARLRSQQHLEETIGFRAQSVVHADLIPTFVGLRIFAAMPQRVRMRAVMAAFRGKGAALRPRHGLAQPGSVPSAACLCLHERQCQCAGRFLVLSDLHALARRHVSGAVTREGGCINTKIGMRCCRRLVCDGASGGEPALHGVHGAASRLPIQWLSPNGGRA